MTKRRNDRKDMKKSHQKHTTNKANQKNNKRRNRRKNRNQQVKMPENDIRYERNLNEMISKLCFFSM